MPVISFTLCNPPQATVPRGKDARRDADDVVVQRREGGELAAADGAEGACQGLAGSGDRVDVAGNLWAAGVEGVLLWRECQRC
jgi:hypothetical protein